MFLNDHGDHGLPPSIAMYSNIFRHHVQCANVHVFFFFNTQLVLKIIRINIILYYIKYILHPYCHLFFLVFIFCHGVRWIPNIWEFTQTDSGEVLKQNLSFFIFISIINSVFQDFLCLKVIFLSNFACLRS